MPESHRDKIRNSNVLNALIEHAEGTRDMSPSQVTAGLGLLRKVMADLSQSDINHSVKRDATDYTKEELVAYLRNARDGGSGIAEQDRGEPEPDSVH